MGQSPVYDRIGGSYSRFRRPDPRIAAQIDAALGDARTVLNIGAGAGSYEIGGRRYTAVDPSPTMLRQRPADAGAAVQAVAEHLPFPEDSFDAASAILTIHHWSDAAAGLTEVRRVSTGRIVVLTWDTEQFADKFWLVRDYLPEAARHDGQLVTLTALRGLLAPCSVEPVPIPHDCTDGFFAAYWRRPEAYLDAGVRAAISGLALLDREPIERMVRTLRADLDSGDWDRRHGHLRDAVTYDNGYRLVIAEPARRTAP